jgi:hypothetical protein
MNTEAMVRNLLQKALDDGIVFSGDHNGDFINFTSEELQGVRKLLEEYLAEAGQNA